MYAGRGETFFFDHLQQFKYLSDDSEAGRPPCDKLWRWLPRLNGQQHTIATPRVQENAFMWETMVDSFRI